MRTLSIALIAAALATPSLGYSQDERTIGGPIGPTLGSPAPAKPGALLAPGAAVADGLDGRMRCAISQLGHPRRNSV